jgi:DNA mismatch endonuclease (patch repair protein)
MRRADYWLPKFQANIDRDARFELQLKELGWNVEVIWECETKNGEALNSRLKEIFSN